MGASDLPYNTSRRSSLAAVPAIRGTLPDHVPRTALEMLECDVLRQMTVRLSCRPKPGRLCQKWTTMRPANCLASGDERSSQRQTP